jgi:hypothetical protein
MAGKKAKAVQFVLDCSITVAWFFEDEVDAYTEAVENSLATARAVVPVLWPLEVANALLMSERLKRTTEAKVGSFLGLLRSLPVTHDAETNARGWTPPTGGRNWRCASGSSCARSGAAAGAGPERGRRRS